MNRGLLAACVALLLTPVGALALRKYSPALWEKIANLGSPPETIDLAPEPAPPGPPPPVPPGPPPPSAAVQPNSLGMVRSGVYDPPPDPVPPPAPPGAPQAPPPLPPVSSDPPSAPPPDPAPPAGKKDFPKLNPTRGWVYTNVRSRQNPGVAQTQAQAPIEPSPSSPLPAPPAPAKPKTETPSPAPSSKPAPPPEPPKRLKRAGGGSRGGGGSVQYGGKVLPQSSVGPGGPMGVMEHGPLVTTLAPPPSPSASAPALQSLPDALPPPNPEHPATSDGPCPKKGWWKNDGTKMCYFSKASCLAGDNNRSACAQPNP